MLEVWDTEFNQPTTVLELIDNLRLWVKIGAPCRNKYMLWGYVPSIRACEDQQIGQVEMLHCRISGFYTRNYVCELNFPKSEIADTDQLGAFKRIDEILTANNWQPGFWVYWQGEIRQLDEVY